MIVLQTVPPTNSDLYIHIRIVVSMIVSLCITTLLSGFARIAQHPRRDLMSVLHLGWAVSLLLWVVHFWWWEFRLTMISRWHFGIYFFVIFYATLYYFLCTLLFPAELKEYANYEVYFLSRRRWFFGFLAATFVADVIDTRIKGLEYFQSFGHEYLVRTMLNIAMCFIGMFTENRKVQLILLCASLLYHVYFIEMVYATQ